MLYPLSKYHEWALNQPRNPLSNSADFNVLLSNKMLNTLICLLRPTIPLSTDQSIGNFIFYHFQVTVMQSVAG